MRVAHFFIKFIFSILLILSIILFSEIIYLRFNLNTDIKIKKGDSISFNTNVPVTAEYNGVSVADAAPFYDIGKQYDIKLRLFGIIPFTKASVEVVDEMQVAVLGNTFGMKIYTEGVLVIDITDVKTENGLKNPAKDAGIKVGDYIQSVNGIKVSTNEDLSEIVAASGGELLKFVIMRNNTKIHISCRAAYSEETKSYKIGIWIKDSSAGVGTLTFYSPALDVVSGLGHGISDSDTGTILEINSGEIVEADIISIEKGKTGSPGKLNGQLSFKTLGNIVYNCECGVYSKASAKIDTSNMCEIALKNEVKNGKAQILCSVEGEPKYYDCTVRIRSSELHSNTQNMIITVTDKKLLSLTGGIVQGMSGSPIIQNGKLIGAVTHVLVDDPAKGYGIFAENMLEVAKSVSKNVGDNAHITPKKEAS